MQSCEYQCDHNCLAPRTCQICLPGTVSPSTQPPRPARSSTLAISGLLFSEVAGALKMVEGYPYGVGGWGVPSIFKEGGRLFGKYCSLLAPFIFAFVLPTAVIQLLEVFGIAWVAAGMNPFLPPGPHSHGHHHAFSKASAEMNGSYPPLPPTPSGRAILIGIAVGILMWLLASLAVASICKVVQYIYSEEEEPSAVKSIFMSLPHALFRLLVTSIWVLLLSMATVITISLPFYLLSLLFKDKHAALLGMLNQLFISIAITILGFLFLLSQEVAVLEPHNYGLAALKRSSKLVQKKFLAALTLFALSILVGGLISKLSTTVAGLPDTGKVPHWIVYVCAPLLAILYLAYMVYILLVTVVLYFSSKVNYDAEEGTLPEFRHSSHENPYTPLVVAAEE